MPKITAQEVEHIAALARLSLNEDDIAKMARDLDRVLEYVATLDEIDVSGIEPTAHSVPLEFPTREDEAVDGMDPELAISNAPASAGTAFLVPKVIGEGDGE